MVKGESYDEIIGNLNVKIKTHKTRATYRL